MIGTVTPPRRDKLDLWVVYRKPRDYPEHYVARLWTDVPSPYAFVLADTLDEIRDALIEVGRVRLERYPGDDSVIVETWL